MRAVNLRSTMSGKRSSIRPVTTSPRLVGRRYLPSLTTYSWLRMVVIVGA